MKNFGTFARAAFFLYEGSFWKNNNCFKKTCFFIIMGIRVDRKKIWLLTIFCPHCCRNFTLSLQSKNLFFLEQFLSAYSFWDPSMNCWDFSGKNFGTFVEAAFYVYRQTIWGETIFSKDFSSSCLFVTWRRIKLTSDNLVSALLTRLSFLILEFNFEIFFLLF